VSQIQSMVYPIVEAKELSVTYDGEKVLELPSLHVYPNEVLVVIGPNGSGKTTLLLCLALLLKPGTGTISYQGKPVLNGASALQLRRKLALVFQESLLLSSTVWDNVTLGLRLRNVKGDDIKARTQKWLERFGIASLAQRQAKTLSGGEAKRASLARAFVLQPDVLFLDEPFNGLDSPTRQALMEDFESVLRETNVTTVMVTHDRNEALVLAHRVIVLLNGHIRQIGSPEEVFSSPVDEEVARFVEEVNILHGVVGAQMGGLASINIGDKQIEVVSELTAGIEVTVLLPHDDVTITLPSSEVLTTSARNHLLGKIVKVFPVSSQIRVTMNFGFPLVALITRRSWVDMGLSIGQQVIASFKASSIQVIPHQFRQTLMKE